MSNPKPPDPVAPVRQARLFRSTGNQAVRIPRELELAADEVLIHREGDRLVLRPVERSPSLAEVLSRLGPLDEEFPGIEDPPLEPEQVFQRGLAAVPGNAQTR